MRKAAPPKPPAPDRRPLAGVRVLDLTFAGDSVYYLSINRNKLSLVLNLRTRDGLNVLYNLVKKSDVQLGQDTAKILGGLLGYSRRRIQELWDAGVTRPASPRS